MATLGDKEIVTTMLSNFKLNAELLTTLALESSNNDLRKNVINDLNRTIQCQNDIFKFMNQKGWYPIEQAPQQEVSRIKQKFNIH